MNNHLNLKNNNN